MVGLRCAGRAEAGVAAEEVGALNQTCVVSQFLGFDVESACRDGPGLVALPVCGGGGGGGGGGLLLDTTSFSGEKARETYWKASPPVREVLLEEARACISAREAAMISMEGRIAQTAVALFAAAAFSATFAAQFRSAALPLAFLGGVSTIAFAVGTAVTLSAMKVGDLVFPGASPSWWADCDFLDESGGEAKARTWVAAQLEHAIESYDQVARRRGALLNLGLRYGAAGVIFMGLAGAVLIFA